MLGEDAASPSVVNRLPQIAREGRVYDDARIPYPGVSGSGVHRKLKAPGGTAVVKLGELLGGEAATQTSAQLSDQHIGDLLEQAHSLCGCLRQTPLAPLPLMDRAIEGSSHCGRG
jgi:hypothetical protein